MVSKPKIRRTTRDMFRISMLLGVTGGLLLYMDVANVVVIQALLIGIFLVGGSHVTRRLLFPKIDLQEYAKKASETPIGSAIVFSAILVFLIAVIHASMSILS